MVCKKKERVVGKGLNTPCLICGERRFTENAHFPKRKRTGEEGTETIPLCPTHHRLLEHGRLNRIEFDKIRIARYITRFQSAEELVAWAYENCYPYSINDMKKKYWEYIPGN